MVSFMHERNTICSQMKLNDIAHEQTIICGHLLAGHVGGSWPMKKTKKFHGMIIFITFSLCCRKNAKLGNVVSHAVTAKKCNKKLSSLDFR